MSRLSTKSLFSLIVLFTLALACGGAPETAPVETDAPDVESTQHPTEAATETPATEEPSNEPLGSTPENPVPLDGILTTPEWEVQVLEVLRGDEAEAKLDEASPFNRSHEDPNMEYMLVNLRVKYLGTNASAHVYGKIFRSIGSAGQIHDAVSFIDVEVPAPELEADLTPGGETTGWVAIQVGKDETDIKLVVWTYVSYENNAAIFSETTPKWYISLE